MLKPEVIMAGEDGGSQEPAKGLTALQEKVAAAHKAYRESIGMPTRGASSRESDFVGQFGSGEKPAETPSVSPVVEAQPAVSPDVVTAALGEVVTSSTPPTEKPEWQKKDEERDRRWNLAFKPEPSPTETVSQVPVSAPVAEASNPTAPTSVESPSEAKKGLMEKGRERRLAMGARINSLKTVVDAVLVSPDAAVLVGKVVGEEVVDKAKLAGGEAQEVGREINEAARMIRDKLQRLENEVEIRLKMIVEDTTEKGQDAAGRLSKAIGVGTMSALRLGRYMAVAGEAAVAKLAQSPALLAEGRAALEERGAKRAESKLLSMDTDEKPSLSDSLLTNSLENEADRSRRNAQDLREGAKRLKDKVERAKFVKRGINALRRRFSGKK